MKLPSASFLIFSVIQGFPTASTAQGNIVNHCQTTPVRGNSVDFPSKHAWDLFMVLNHPAIDETIVRGKPDCALPIGSPGTTSVWETWRNAATEVFLEDGSEPPHWNDTNLPDESPGQVPMNRQLDGDALVADRFAASSTLSLSFHSFSASTIELRFSPVDGIFEGLGGFGETRMNRTTYDFIKQNCLWSKEGQSRYAEQVLAGNKPPIVFPVDSIEVKAAWIDFANPDPTSEDDAPIPPSEWARYYTAEHEGKNYGLVALHVVTKDIPNWFWASFHHESAPDNPYGNPDLHGRPSALDGTVWENYLLSGTQLDFVTPTGEATILSDHYVEYNFQRSSCISCHSMATAAPDGSPGPNQLMALCMLNGSLPDLNISGDVCRSIIGSEMYLPSSDDLWEERGTPLARWFNQDDELFHVQTDFLWSLPFRARNENFEPPARCQW